MKSGSGLSLLLFALLARAEPPSENASAPGVPPPPTNSAATATPTNPPSATAAPRSVGHPELLAPGLRVELAAALPADGVPTALAFDARGQLYVALRRNREAGEVWRLRDADGDGRFETNSRWAEGLPATGGMVAHGAGVLLAAGGDLLWLRGGTNDATATLTSRLFSGFPAEARPPQLAWRPDGRVHAVVPRPFATLQAEGGDRLNLGTDDFSFHPRTGDVRPEPGGQHTAVAFDRAGRRFTSSPGAFLRLTMAPLSAARQNPFFTWTELTAPLLPGNQAGAANLLIYGGGQLPDSYAGNVFLAEPKAGTVLRLAGRENGVVAAPAVPRDQRTAVWLRGEPGRFRPTALAAGPEGAIYVADAGPEGDPARLWRVLPTAAKAAPAPDLTREDTVTLAGRLAGPNQWARESAAHLLRESRDTNTDAFLRRQLGFGRSAQARLGSLQVLAARNELTAADLVTALRDADPAVRETAVELATPWVLADRAPGPLWQALLDRTRDPSVRVRFQLALTLGHSARSAATPALSFLLRAHSNDPWLRRAALGALNGRADAVFLDLLEDPRARQSDAGWALLLTLAEMAGLQPHSDGGELLNAIERARPGTADLFQLATAVARGLHDGGRDWPGAAPDGTWRRFAAAALEVSLSTRSAAMRAAATRYLGVSGLTAPQVSDWALALLAPGESPEVQSAAVACLSRFEDPAIVAAYWQRWPRLAESTRRDILTALLQRPDRTYFLMNALESGVVPVTALAPEQANFLRTHYDATTARRARALLGGEVNQRAGLAERFAPAVLKLAGDAGRGRAIFANRCLACHQWNGAGRAFGPDLAGAADQPPEELLRDILEPNARLTPSHQTEVVLRTNGELLVGLVRANVGDVLAVESREGEVRHLPQRVVMQTAPQSWSLMPENAAAGLSAQDLADLLAFLRRVGPGTPGPGP